MGATEHANNHEPALWCAGMPLVSQRPLTEEERHLLMTSLRHSRRAVNVALTAPWTLLLVGLALAQVVGPEVGDTVGKITAIAFIFTLIRSILTVLDHSKVVSGLRRDLAFGMVDVYQGPLNSLSRRDASFFREAGFELRLVYPVLVFEVLSCSGFLFSQAGRPAANWQSIPRKRGNDPRGRR